MKEIISQTSEAWEEKVDLRNAYTFGNEDVSLDEFSKLFKDTFEIIRTVKNEYICKGIMPNAVNSFNFFNYLRLLTFLSKYMTYDCTPDESKDQKFTATCLIAQKLVDYATFCIGGFEKTGETITYFDGEDEKQGLFTFYRDDYPFFSSDFDEDNENPIYSYNIYEANFDEILELASQL